MMENFAKKLRQKWAKQWDNAGVVEYGNGVETKLNTHTGRIAVYNETGHGQIFQLPQQQADAEAYLNGLVEKNK